MPAIDLPAGLLASASMQSVTDDATEILTALLSAFGAQGFDAAVARIGGEWVAAGLPAAPAEVRDPALARQFELALEVIETDVAHHLIRSADLGEVWQNGFTMVGPLDDDQDDFDVDDRESTDNRTLPSALRNERSRTAGRQLMALIETLRQEQELTVNTQGDG